MRKILSIFLVMTTGAAALVLSSCKDETPDNSPREPLELSRNTVKVGNKAEKIHIGVTARNASWSMTGDETWCRVDPAGGDLGVTQMTVDFLENDSGVDRKTTFIFVSGNVRKEIVVEQYTYEIQNPDVDEEYSVNKHIHEEILNEWYLWNSETATAKPDYNQSSKKFFKNYLENLKDNGMDGNTWSDNTRYLYSYIRRYPKDVAQLPPFDFGMDFELEYYDGKIVGRILYVSKGSPAEKAGLKRSNWFFKVNTREMWDKTYYNRIDSIIHPLENVNITLGMLTFRSSDKRLIDEKKTVTLTPERYRRNPILGQQVITRLTTGESIPRTGYLAYTNFDPLFRTQLIEAFTNFKGEAVQELVLDLRYSKSGAVEMAAEMANLIVPTSTSGIFASLRFNETVGRTETISYAPDDSSLGLRRVFILTSPHTAGPAELLINAFRDLEKTGQFKIITIGDTTEGMNVGMVKQSHATEDPNATEEYVYEVYPVSFEVGEYRYGMMPVSRVSEWEGDNIKWRTAFDWSGQVGHTEDVLLQTAVNFIGERAEIPVDMITDQPSRQKSWPKYPREYSVQMSMTAETPQ